MERAAAGDAVRPRRPLPHLRANFYYCGGAPHPAALPAAGAAQAAGTAAAGVHRAGGQHAAAGCGGPGCGRRPARLMIIRLLGLVHAERAGHVQLCDSPSAPSVATLGHSCFIGMYLQFCRPLEFCSCNPSQPTQPRAPPRPSLPSFTLPPCAIARNHSHPNLESGNLKIWNHAQHQRAVQRRLILQAEAAPPPAAQLPPARRPARLLAPSPAPRCAEPAERLSAAPAVPPAPARPHPPPVRP